MNVSKKLQARRLLNTRRDSARRFGPPLHTWSEAKLFPGIATTSTLFLSTPLQASKTFYEQVVKSGKFSVTEQVKDTPETCATCGSVDHFSAVCPSKPILGKPTPLHDLNDDRDKAVERLNTTGTQRDALADVLQMWIKAHDGPEYAVLRSASRKAMHGIRPGVW